jgi:hypothetical protein
MKKKTPFIEECFIPNFIHTHELVGQDMDVNKHETVEHFT